ncbi:MAG: hypothetical protein ACOCQA_02510 [bacterium]
MPNYTPGPWKPVIGKDQPVPYYKRLICLVESDGQNRKAVVVERDVAETVSKDEWKANTRLLAAAPELLEAAEKVLRIGVAGYDDLREAVHKAKGEN